MLLEYSSKRNENMLKNYESAVKYILFKIFPQDQPFSKPVINLFHAIPQPWTKGWKQIHEIKQNRFFCGMFHS